MSAKILLVDDDNQVLNMLRMNFEDEGYTVLTGADGQEALQMASALRPDVIIMDVNMPIFNGLKVLEVLRSREESRATPVILLTGAQSDTIYPSIESQQRVSFIKKPVDLEDINSLIKQTLTKYPRRP